MVRPSATRVAYQHLIRKANVKTAYLEISDEAKAIVAQSLATLLGLLRAQNLSYQTSHWQAAGRDFYGNHQLFDRLYGSTHQQIDELAEKMVGYLGPSAVELGPSVDVLAAWASKWAQTECPFYRGTVSEKDCQATIKQAYEAIKACDGMTLGLDDWLMATASAHEQNTYLLQQVLRSKDDKRVVEP